MVAAENPAVDLIGRSPARKDFQQPDGEFLPRGRVEAQGLGIGTDRNACSAARTGFAGFLQYRVVVFRERFVMFGHHGEFELS